MRNPVDGPLYGDLVQTDITGDMGGRKRRMEIEIDRKISEGEEKEKEDSGAQTKSFQDHQDGAEAKEDQEKNNATLEGKERGKGRVKTG